VRSLVERAAGTDVEVITLGRPELDLAGSPATIRSTVESASPDIIVSAAAYTQVDKAESERETAFAVNERGPGAIAQAARAGGVPLIHLSTDYVFDGSKDAPYVEGDPTRPTGVYGASKLAGEKAVLAEHRDSVVLRTAWVYSPFSANFMKTMLRLAGDRGEISVVADQHGCPTSALDIADGILRVAANLRADSAPEKRGMFHMAGAGEASWAEFAEAIFAASADRGGPSATVKRIGASDFPTAARRPANSRLDSNMLGQVHGVALPDWRVSMTAVLQRLLQLDPSRSNTE
jgi:dTDP-4-dehydrorhamnose reductase